MKITSKGQVTIPQAVREKAGLHPHSEVEFEVRENGEVILRAVTAPAATAVPPSPGCAAAPTRCSSRTWEPTNSWRFCGPEPWQQAH